MSLNPGPSYVPHDIFAQNHLQILPARQIVPVHQKPVSRAKQTNCAQADVGSRAQRKQQDIPFI